VLSVRGLALSRGDRPLIQGLTFEVAPGQAVALTGANGAGKTTLLRTLAGFLRPDAGEVLLDGRPVDERRGDLHWLGHLDGLKGARLARDELGFLSAWLGAGPAGIARAAERLRLGPLLDLPVRTLSAGQKRRLAFGRLLAAPRPVWLLDEPAAPLDAEWRSRFGEVCAEHLASGGLIVAAVHDDPPFPARTLAIGAEA
jgi:heme exporter protein A